MAARRTVATGTGGTVSSRATSSATRGSPAPFVPPRLVKISTLYFWPWMMTES